MVPDQDVGPHKGVYTPNIDLGRGDQTLAVDQEPLELDLDAEVTEDGQNKEDLREWIFRKYCRGVYSGELCFDLYDKYELWPAKKAEFWAVFVEGIMACRSKYDPLPSAPVTPQRAPVTGNPDFGFQSVADRRGA